MASSQETKQSLDIDQMLTVVGEYGRFQKIVNFLFCMMMFPAAFPLLITYFSVQNPHWKCSSTSNVCTNKSATYAPSDTARCSPKMSRSDWEYVTTKSYSIVTEFDLICEKDYLIQLQTSVLFFGFIFGALIMGWFADNFGRKRVLFTSLTVVMCVGFTSVFVGNIFVFVACRFVIGVFLHGTFPQLYIMISEIVGNKHRAFANNMTVFSVGFGYCTLALKAYLLPNWRYLFIACTVPYMFLLLSITFVPESVRYHRVRGQLKEAMEVFRKMAYWNKTVISDGITISPVVSNSCQKSSPLDLFRTRKMAHISCILSWSSFTDGLSFYCLYYTAGKISGHMYIDFVLITVIDIPTSLILTPLVDKFGRKRCSMAFTFFAAASCLALGFTPSHGNLKYLRICLGMFGKTCNVMSGMSATTWRIELYPTIVRGEAGGLRQLTNKVGATSSAWINKWLGRLHPGGVFILIGGVQFVTVLLQSTLWETNGTAMSDTIDPDDKGDSLSQHIKETYLPSKSKHSTENKLDHIQCVNPTFEE